MQAGPPCADELLDAAAELVRTLGRRARSGSPPSRRSADLGRALAERLGLPFLDVLARTEPRPPQTEMANAATQAANVRGAFAVTRRRARRQPACCVDDVRRSGWTLAMVAGQLRRRGAAAVHPLRAGYCVLRRFRASSTSARAEPWPAATFSCWISR